MSEEKLANSIHFPSSLKFVKSKVMNAVEIVLLEKE